MPPTTIDRMAHIREAIASIREAVAGKTLQSFTADKLLRLAIERLLEIVSEASRHLPADLKADAPEINWRRLADLGNWLRHAYHRTDAGLVWTMIENDLDALDIFVTRHANGAAR